MEGPERLYGRDRGGEDGGGCCIWARLVRAAAIHAKTRHAIDATETARGHCVSEISSEGGDG
eukprot:7458248-Pyramimonas_sp.AAC.1